MSKAIYRWRCAYDFGSGERSPGPTRLVNLANLNSQVSVLLGLLTPCWLQKVQGDIAKVAQAEDAAPPYHILVVHRTKACI